MSTAKKLQVEFAPGAFDTFEGTQEELDQLMAEITSMFGNMSAEDFESQNIVALDENSLTPEEWAVLDVEDALFLSRGQYLQ
jgi:hypothetical protein